MINRLPLWFKQEIPKDIDGIKNRLDKFREQRLSTVCVSAHCPNIYGCFKRNAVTFMIMGENCSRSCRFCAVGKGRLKPLDLYEAYNLAESLKDLQVRYAVITSVTRDDLPLGGASHFVRAVIFTSLRTVYIQKPD